MIVFNSMLIKQSCSGIFHKAQGTTTHPVTALLLLDINQEPKTHLSL